MLLQGFFHLAKLRSIVQQDGCTFCNEKQARTRIAAAEERIE